MIALSRRCFIKGGAGLTLATATVGLPTSLMSAPQAKWPVGCRDVHLKLADQPDSWSAMKTLGAEGIEAEIALNLACANLFHPQRKYSLASPDGVRVLKDDLAAGGGRITAFMMANRFDERLEEELACARGLVNAAQQLGVDTIRIDVVPRKLGVDEFLPFAIRACKRMCEIAEGTPVRYGVENHGKITNDPQFLDRLFDGVGSPKFGLTLDCANFYWWGHPLKDLYAIYEKLARRVVHVHCKNIRYPEEKKNVRREMGWEYGQYNCPIYDGDIDYARVAKILRRAGYGGDLCVENESLGKFPETRRGEILKREIAALKRLV